MPSTQVAPWEPGVEGGDPRHRPAWDAFYCEGTGGGEEGRQVQTLEIQRAYFMKLSHRKSRRCFGKLL